MIFRSLTVTKRQLRNHRAFQVCIRFVLPDPWLRSRVGAYLCRWSDGLNRACYRWFGWPMVCRPLMPRFSCDELVLLSYTTDIRQILSDNALADMTNDLNDERRTQ